MWSKVFSVSSPLYNSGVIATQMPANKVLANALFKTLLKSQGKLQEGVGFKRLLKANRPVLFSTGTAVKSHVVDFKKVDVFAELVDS